jgi:hypothetical protein
MTQYGRLNHDLQAIVLAQARINKPERSGALNEAKAAHKLPGA